MSPASIIVTGANRGIGYGLVRQFLKDSNVRYVIATARNPSKADVNYLNIQLITIIDLFQDLKSINDKRLSIAQLDVTSDISINSFVDNVGAIVGDNGVNLLVNNAGLMLPYSSKHEPDRESINTLLNTNATGVVILTQKLIPHLMKAAEINKNMEMSINKSAVITISSILGSISENKDGSSSFDTMAYRISKAAVHQFVKTFAIDMKESGILSAAFHPGWVQTDMGGPNGTLTVEQSTQSLVSSFAKLREHHTGFLFNSLFKKINY